MNTTVVIIDDGVSEELIPNLQFKLKYKNKKISHDESCADIYSHGSICAGIIKKYAPNTQIGSIRFLDNKGRGTINGLVTSIKWCIDNNVKLIHLSNGTTQACDIPKLYKVISEAVHKGIIIVSACKNERNVSFPASFESVIGVRADVALNNTEFYLNKHPNGGIDISASSVHCIYLSANESVYTTLFSNSFAAPVISAIIYNKLSTTNFKLNYSEIRTELYKISKNTFYDERYYLNILSYFKNLNSSHDVPLVVFVGEDAYSLVQYIAKRFLYDNYLPLLFSQNINDCSHECFYIESAEMFKSVYCTVAEFYGASLLLAIILENNIISLDPDVIIIINGTGKDIASNSNIKTIYAEMFNEDVVYKQLLDMLMG
ncbi:MAG: S8 family serine peptidase [Oscillospiraceae bacterium]|jgi:hypothetical protein|nr:S8 family serine peptidase [Oscillospiraceae bacterium]